MSSARFRIDRTAAISGIIGFLGWRCWTVTHLRLRQLDQVLLDGGPFVFPLEFRWEVIKWMKRFAKGKPAEFLTPHIPPAGA